MVWTEEQRQAAGERMRLRHEARKKKVINLNEGEPIDERPQAVQEVGGVETTEIPSDIPAEEMTPEAEEAFTPPLIRTVAQINEKDTNLITLRGIVSGLEDRVLACEQKLGIRK